MPGPERTLAPEPTQATPRTAPEGSARGGHRRAWGGQQLASTLATPRQETCHLPELDTLSQCCPDQPAVGAGTVQTPGDPWARGNQKGQGSSCQA